ncbi:MAG: hypothetical protein J6C95_00950 [Muribaculaceae bacterium]|nr:hypothetical protein [Muribaculaceae bacterium]
MDILVPILIPIAVVVVLPCVIVWIVFKTQTNRDNKNAEIVIKAIENNQVTGTDKIIEAIAKNKKSPVEVLQSRLLRACIFTFIGVSSLLLSIIFNYRNILSEQDLVTGFAILGAMTLPIGLAYMVVYFATRKSVMKRNEE